MAEQYKLYDQSFCPDAVHRTEWYQAEYWTKDGPDTPEATFYTDWVLHTAPPRGDGVRRVAVLLEPPEIITDFYDLVATKTDTFDRVATHQRDLCHRDPERYFYYPYGTTWIHDPADRRIHPKTRGVSIVASDKRTAVGHKLRHALVAALGRSGAECLDMYGSGYLRIERKIEALAPYRFTVVVENSRAAGYFTEKLVDALLTGTVPIYWGDPAIGDHFDLGGMMIAESLDELIAAVRLAADPQYGAAIYQRMASSVADNFALAQRYLAPDRWLAERIGALLPSR